MFDCVVNRQLSDCWAEWQNNAIKCKGRELRHKDQRFVEGFLLNQGHRSQQAGKEIDTAHDLKLANFVGIKQTFLPTGSEGIGCHIPDQKEETGKGSGCRWFATSGTSISRQEEEHSERNQQRHKIFIFFIRFPIEYWKIKGTIRQKSLFLKD